MGSRESGAPPEEPAPPPDVHNLSVRDSQPELRALAETSTPPPAYTNMGVGRDDATDTAWDGKARKKSEPVKDFFSYTDQDPPTEEGNEPVYEDRAPLYVAPMNVPEPTPIPGLFERSVADSGALPRSALVRPTATEPEEEEPRPGSSWPLMMIVFGAASVGGVLGLIALGIMALWGRRAEAPPEEEKPIPVLAPAPPPPVVEPVPVPAPPPVDPPVPVPQPPPSEPLVASPPVVAKKAPKPAAVKSRLEIRSNRRVMVWVDGGAPDFAPLDLTVSPGTHVIKAAEPGKASTTQTLSVEVVEGQTKVVQLTF